jgi:predicted RNase H-like nuclease (RuvC/YqgF family)
MDTQELSTKVAILERDMSRVSLIIDKLDATIDKLSDFSSSIKELLAVHDHKLQVQIEVNNEIYSLIRDLKDENHRDHLETKQQIQILSRRMDAFERWKYTLIGGAIVVGFFLSKAISEVGFT